MNWRALGVALAGVWAAYFLLAWVTRAAPGVDTWFIWQLARLWSWVLFLNAGCVAAGVALVRWWVPTTTRLEALALGFPVGVVVFVLGVYGFGAVGALGPVFAVLWPLTMLLAGLGPLLGALEGGSFTLRGLALLRWLGGLALLGVIYLGVMTPDAINYDASWNHLVIAQDYAREGRVVPFLADWNKNMPHLGSVLNAWAFMVPGFELPALKWMLALHLEFLCFVWTLAGVAAATRWLARSDAPGSWAVFALFPGLFVYDGNLGAAADHFTALFGVPLLLVTCLAWRRPFGRVTWLWGVLAGGALLSKTQGVYLVAPPLLALLGRLLWLGARRVEAPRALVTQALHAGGATLLVFSPHLLGNLVFHHNPVFPLMQDVFTGSTPTVPDAAMHVRTMLADWTNRAPDAPGARLWEALQLLGTFSFLPHYSFVKGAPVFGQTFTLCLPWLLVLPRARRLWAGALLALGATFVWAATYRVDRNLQAATPLMMAATAAILARAWALGAVARVGVVALLTAQLAWASGWYFDGHGRMEAALRLLRGATDGSAQKQLRSYRAPYVALGASLPPDATVLLHNSHVMLGIDRRVLLDWSGFQGLYDYRSFRSVGELYARLRETGVTHVVWIPGERTSRTQQEEVIFGAFVDRYGASARAFEQLRVIALPPTPPPVEAPYQVLALGMWAYADGLYPVETLSTYEGIPRALQHYAAPARPTTDQVALIDEARAVLIANHVKRSEALQAVLARDFRPVQTAGDFQLLLRR